MKLYPTKVSQVMSWTEMFFGLGYMLGPALGAFLYEAGGFKTPFWVVGSLGLLVAIGMIFLVPNVKSDEAAIKVARGKQSLNFVNIIKVRDHSSIVFLMNSFHHVFEDSLNLAPFP